MSDYNQQMEVLLDKRVKMIEELKKVQAELYGLNNQVRGRQLLQAKYDSVCEQQSILTKRKLEIEAGIAGIKTDIRKLDAIKPKQANIVRVGTLTHDDLSNALMEPQALLQRTHSHLLKLTKTYGVSNESRALLDSLHDYLYRQGMILDRVAK